MCMCVCELMKLNIFKRQLFRDVLYSSGNHSIRKIRTSPLYRLLLFLFIPWSPLMSWVLQNLLAHLVFVYEHNFRSIEKREKKNDEINLSGDWVFIWFTLNWQTCRKSTIIYKSNKRYEPESCTNRKSSVRLVTDFLISIPRFC